MHDPCNGWHWHQRSIMNDLPPWGAAVILLIIVVIALTGCIDDPASITRGWTP